jgi:hypothetical protein
MPATNDNAMSAYSEHEKLTATRMHWWGVYLIREQRRLQGIADRVRSQEAARATGHHPNIFHQENTDNPPDDLQATPDYEAVSDQLLTRLDAEAAKEDALSALGDQDDDNGSY